MKVSDLAWSYPNIAKTAGADKQIKKAWKFCEGYKKFLDIGKTERECVNEVEIMLVNAGYERFDVNKKYKAGELDLDDLPLPIFETDEEREKRENALAGGKKKDKKKRKALWRRSRRKRKIARKSRRSWILRRCHWKRKSWWQGAISSASSCWTIRRKSGAERCQSSVRKF